MARSSNSGWFFPWPHTSLDNLRNYNHRDVILYFKYNSSVWPFCTYLSMQHAVIGLKLPSNRLCSYHRNLLPSGDICSDINPRHFCSIGLLEVTINYTICVMIINIILCYILFSYRSDSLVFHFGVFHGLPSLYDMGCINTRRKINDIIYDSIVSRVNILC